MKYILIVLCAVASAPAFAGWVKIPSDDFHVQPYPIQGTPEYQRDFDILFKYQAARTERDCKAAKAQKYPTFGVMWKKSNLFNADELKDYTVLMNKVAGFAARVSEKIKEDFMRPRPYDEDKRLKPCIDKPGGSKAYPSSHATIAATSACILAEVKPNKAADILAYGDYLGELRVIAGVHHPSDIEAARDLAQQICDRLLSEKDFRKDLEELN